MREVLAKNPRRKVLIIGLVAYALPEAFEGLEVTIVRGEPERLLWKLDDVLNGHTRTVDVGSVRELDHLPFPDWSLFDPSKFKIAYDFTRFPTGLVQQSRGCTFTCNYCPYIIVENTTRFRTPESVFEELRQGIQKYGFRSFKFRDPLFGLDRKRVLAAGRADRQAAAQDRILDRKPHRSAAPGNAAHPPRSRADDHHRRHRNARRGYA